MARAYGRNARMHFAFEETYGTPPGGAYHRVPFISSSLGTTESFLEDDVLGEGREPGVPERGPVEGDGRQVVVPVEARDFGLWLKLLLGAPETDGDGPYTHVYTGGAAALPSAAIELAHPQVPRYFMNSGVMARSLALELRRDGTTQATFGLAQQDESDAGASAAGTPTTNTRSRFSQRQGSLTLGGSPIANLIAGRLTWDNGLEPVPTVRGDGLIEGYDPGAATGTGELVCRFADMDLFNATKGAAPDAVAITLGWTISAGLSLQLALARCYLDRPLREVRGPGGIEVTYPFRHARAANGDSGLAVTLINDVESY